MADDNDTDKFVPGLSPGHLLDRRTFVEKSLRAVGSGVVAGGILGSVLERDAAASPLSASASTSTLRVAQVDGPRNLDLDQVNALFRPNYDVWIPTYDTLADTPFPRTIQQIRAQGPKAYLARPKLATAWSFNRDKSIYRLHIRKGVKSSFGNELTADDVLWRFQRGLSIGAVFKGLAGGLGLTNPGQLRAVDRYTVDFTLSRPSPDFLPTLAVWLFGIIDSTEAKKHATSGDPWAQTWLSSNIAGFGPFALQSYTQGQGATLTARANYWGAKPWAGTLQLQGVPDPNTRTQLLLTGQTDVAVGLSTTELSLVAKSSTMHNLRYASSNAVYIVFNNQTAPFNDRRIRQGIALAMPYKQIVNNIYNGNADRWRTLIPPWFPGATDQYWQYETNLAKAKQLLAPLQGQSITLPYSDANGTLQSLAIVIQTALKAVGLDIQLQLTPAATFGPRRNAGSMPIYLDDRGTAVVDTLDYVSTLFVKGGVQNAGNAYSNPALDRLVAQLASAEAASITSNEAQRKIIGQIQKILVTDLPIVPLAFTGSIISMSKKLTFAKAHGATGIVWLGNDVHPA